jgi:hypothetical protein
VLGELADRRALPASRGHPAKAYSGHRRAVDCGPFQA